jgi:hypothetical protein
MAFRVVIGRDGSTLVERFVKSFVIVIILIPQKKTVSNSPKRYAILEHFSQCPGRYIPVPFRLVAIATQANQSKHNSAFPGQFARGNRVAPQSSLIVQHSNSRNPFPKPFKNSEQQTPLKAI